MSCTMSSKVADRFLICVPCRMHLESTIYTDFIAFYNKMDIFHVKCMDFIAFEM